VSSCLWIEDLNLFATLWIAAAILKSTLNYLWLRYVVKILSFSIFFFFERSAFSWISALDGKCCPSLTDNTGLGKKLNKICWSLSSNKSFSFCISFMLFKIIETSNSFSISFFALSRRITWGVLNSLPIDSLYIRYLKVNLRLLSLLTSDVNSVFRYSLLLCKCWNYSGSNFFE